MAVVRKIPAIVSQVLAHTESVHTYVLKPEKKLPKFKCGQFLHFALDAYDPSQEWPDSRVFSIASSPTRRDTIRVTVSAKGQFTWKMIQGVKEGDMVWLKLPYGDFVFNDHDSHLILIAGGTGITPFISYLEFCQDSRIDRQITLYHGVRSPEYLIYKDTIETCDRLLPNFSCKLYLEKGEIQGSHSGMLNPDTVHEETSHKICTYYLSGPWALIDAFQTRLTALGVKEEQIRIDEWE